ncbi:MULTISPECIES: polyprenyl synthetase family protein [unclassified Massilia]|uniref:polyprenyl synthetase family protein n=1 Tax=unclassified Massilia TaxID=2609279 RepID=UPI0009E6D683|nr:MULTISPECIES: polyprenyl synthetase family protein [unclassified Massilia]
MSIQARRHEDVGIFDGFPVQPPNELDTLRQAIEHRLGHWLNPDAARADLLNADLLNAAMRAAALGAGKRMRPLLVMLVARDLGCTSPALVDVACAVELVHAASLILDDMPCMDNALLRRGRPTVHVQFGEDVTILAAIALLSRAFGILAAAQDVPPAVRARLVARLAETVGTQGLVQGQYLDLRGSRGTENDIAVTNELKTGVLLGVAVDMAAIVAQAEDTVAASLRAFALAAGHAFQLRDDFLDVAGNDSAVTGKDTGKDAHKATLINAVGQDEARRRLALHLHDAERHLADALGPRPDTRRFVDGLFGRVAAGAPN